MAKESKKTYLCIDLKSFYASVECVERGLDPLKTNLVVADIARTEKTICLAVTPSMKAYGIAGRARMFEVIQKIKEANLARLSKIPAKAFGGQSYDAEELNADPNLEIAYITAPPRMAHYLQYSSDIYEIYLKYIAPEDILVYSIDEVFLDISNYLTAYQMSAEKLAETIISEVLRQSGITAAAGIGSNMYLAKVAMDIKAKKIPANKDGWRIAYLDEMSYRRELWQHRPLSDFWRVGGGYAKKLEANCLFTMGDIAQSSTTVYGRMLLKKLFGINAKLLIDHAWGYEPCTLAQARDYLPEDKSLGSGQVLQEPYTYQKAKLIVQEMAEQLALDLLAKGFLTKQITLTIGYDKESLTESSRNYQGAVKTDHYGRIVPKSAHGTANIAKYTSSGRAIVEHTVRLYEQITDPSLLVRRISLTANKILEEKQAVKMVRYEQLQLFEELDEWEETADFWDKERKIQQTAIDIKAKFGRNAILKGLSLQEGATAVLRNQQIGGHKA